MHTLDHTQAKEQIIPRIKKDRVKYRKCTSIVARPGVVGEVINTNTSDGFETTNTVKDGDFVVTNNTKAQENYILTTKQINTRYFPPEDISDESLANLGYKLYKAKGQCFAVEATEEFMLIAAWGETQPVKVGDFLASPDETYSEVYRIARKEFFETYERA